MPHSCMDESGFGQVVMLRTLEGSSKDWGARQEGAATVDHVSPSGGGWPTTHGARGSPGPGTKAPCAAARGSELAARQQVGPPIAVVLRARGDKDRNVALSMVLASPSWPWPSSFF